MSNFTKLNKIAVIVHKDNFKVILSGPHDNPDLWEHHNKLKISDVDTISLLYRHKYIKDISLTIIIGEEGEIYIYNIDDTNNTKIEIVDLENEISLSDCLDIEQLKQDLYTSSDIETLYKGKDMTEFRLQVLDKDIRMTFNNRYNITYSSKPMQIIF